LQGGRLVTDAFKHPTADLPAAGVPPNLADCATAGVILEILDSEGLLTDVVREADCWIVAIRQDGDIQGYAADTLGEAAAWALLAGWGEDLGLSVDIEVA
jgi:hypothetical protein